MTPPRDIEQTVLIPGAGGLREQLHWRGKPSFPSLALRVWRLPLVVFYFAALLGDGLWRLWVEGGTAAGWRGEFALLLISAATTGTLTLLAWLCARASTYEITQTHLVLRYGVGLKARLAIPFAAVETVAVRMGKGGSGDIAVKLKSTARLNYIKLWPHVRPLTVLRPTPMLRSVASAGYVGSLLTARVQAAAVIRGALEAAREARAADGLRARSEPPSADLSLDQGAGVRAAGALAV